MSSRARHCIQFYLTNPHQTWVDRDSAVSLQALLNLCLLLSVQESIWGSPSLSIILHLYQLQGSSGKILASLERGAWKIQTTEVSTLSWSSSFINQDTSSVKLLLSFFLHDLSMSPWSPLAHLPALESDPICCLHSYVDSAKALLYL